MAETLLSSTYHKAVGPAPLCCFYNTFNMANGIKTKKTNNPELQIQTMDKCFHNTVSQSIHFKVLKLRVLTAI